MSFLSRRGNSPYARLYELSEEGSVPQAMQAAKAAERGNRLEEWSAPSFSIARQTCFILDGPVG